MKKQKTKNRLSVAPHRTLGNDTASWPHRVPRCCIIICPFGCWSNFAQKRTRIAYWKHIVLHFLKLSFSCVFFCRRKISSNGATKSCWKDVCTTAPMYFFMGIHFRFLYQRLGTLSMAFWQTKRIVLEKAQWKSLKVNTKSMWIIENHNGFQIQWTLCSSSLMRACTSCPASHENM